MKKSLKEKLIKNMFDHISIKYDFINRILSLGMDIIWRKKLVYLLNNFHKKKNFLNILDLATGTGDLTFLLSKIFTNSYIIGLDPSNKMLEIAKNKLNNSKNILIKKRIQFITGYSQNIPFKNKNFDIVTISFGIRNFQFLHLSLNEIYRILKNNGTLAILEFSIPSNFLIRKIYYFYNNLFMSNIGGFLSKNYSAFNYLKESIKHFNYSGEKMKKLLTYHNFNYVHMEKLSLEIASIYLSKKITNNNYSR
ncbi:bifunctional demethylmenaquinone methyltransferase/2-methoxy-6-polyprenyl-1,4-benzoquinol methylase UbiE [Blattabacterium cuenoti]|uniref:bifunctional demethylmenaquinone methyltransferase/2-methoxy-6-polyprenyl-1,4-benzoquinol methylase UbiE n=1 Tax=Blattabacterium cuenoti TaxID=1653831 RepID=UPI00163BC6B5|nr:bifunctional demethylmenaquinone methyltransferase/2-methoxy-6-polyprenyl-1,4-benzoquinol methylase UbiE [Blattabacterium cuenoti]